MAEKIHTALYVVATPIGNLRDITLRALDVLKAVDVIFAEDTRKTRVLLEHYSIARRLTALHAHNELEAAEKVIAFLRQGRSVALVSDAGTPGVSDPGAKVSARVRQAGFPVVPLPGANAALAAFSASGLDASAVTIFGFLPRTESQRCTALEGLKSHEAALIFYEAPHRILATVNDMAEILGEERRSVIARELTKVHESFFSGALLEAKLWLQEDANHRKGEFVVIVAARAQREQPDDAEIERILKTLAGQLPLKQAAALAAEITGANRKKLYALGLTLKNK